MFYCTRAVFSKYLKQTDKKERELLAGVWWWVWPGKGRGGVGGVYCLPEFNAEEIKNVVAQSRSLDTRNTTTVTSFNWGLWKKNFGDLAG